MRKVGAISPRPFLLSGSAETLDRASPDDHLVLLQPDLWLSF